MNLQETLHEIARQQIPTDRALHSVGLARASELGSPSQSFAMFGLGILIGAGLGLLFAPTSGRELRDRLHEGMATSPDEPLRTQ